MPRVKFAQYLEIHNEMLLWGSFGLHRLTIGKYF